MFQVILVIAFLFLVAFYMVGIFLVVVQQGEGGRCASCSNFRRNWAALSTTEKWLQGAFYAPVLAACAVIGC
jgi:hypothetical protein